MTRRLRVSAAVAVAAGFVLAGCAKQIENPPPPPPPPAAAPAPEATPAPAPATESGAMPAASGAAPAASGAPAPVSMKYKCPKCNMEFDAPGKCAHCNVDLVPAT